MHAKKAVHFGGGAIGRGFVGQFLHKSGYELVFVDVAAPIIDLLNAQPSYTVTEVGDGPDNHVTIDNYRAINSKTDEARVVDEIATADIVTCAVGPNVLRFVAPLIAAGLNARDRSAAPAAVIACENAINATDTLAGFIRPALSAAVTADEPAYVRFANSAVDRIVPFQGSSPAGASSLDVRIEKFFEWCVESPPFDGAVRPEVEGIKYVNNLQPYIERKLFTVNTGHATAAYYGYQADHRFIHQAMANRRIRDLVKSTLSETADLIISKHGIARKDQEEYVDMIVRRISNTALEDEVERVGRAPLRKLSRKERLIAPAAELVAHGHSCDYLLGAINVAFRFVDVPDDAESAELGRILRHAATAAEVVEKVCGLDRSDPAERKLFDRVEEIVSRVQDDVRLSDKGSARGGTHGSMSGVRTPVPAEINDAGRGAADRSRL